MKTLVFLLLIILTFGVFTLNATTSEKTEMQQPEAPAQALAGFKKDISTAD